MKIPSIYFRFFIKGGQDSKTRTALTPSHFSTLAIARCGISDSETPNLFGDIRNFLNARGSDPTLTECDVSGHFFKPAQLDEFACLVSGEPAAESGRAESSRALSEGEQESPEAPLSEDDDQTHQSGDGIVEDGHEEEADATLDATLQRERRERRGGRAGRCLRARGRRSAPVMTN
jgi:hypothetical protein